MTPLRAFHGNPAIKATYLARVRAHREADELIHGTYWEDGKGCAVGCTIHGSDHSDYERKLGVPTILAYLEDRLFESLPAEAAQQWPAAFLEAIPVGADLSLVWPKFAVWLLTDPQDGVVRFSRDDQARHAITGVAGLYQRVCTGQAVSREEWTAARAAAYDASYRAAGNAAWASATAGGVATYAARKAARTVRATGEATFGTDDEEAAWAATRATRTAARIATSASLAWGTAIRVSAAVRQAEKLLELLRAA